MRTSLPRSTVVEDVIRFVVTTACILLAPVVVGFNFYDLTILTNVAMFATPALGAWLLIQTGLFSFGQGIFASMGSYTSAILIARYSLSFWSAFFLGGLAATVLGALVAYPFLRTRRVTFSVLTMVGLLAVDQVIIVWPHLSGGGSGLLTPPLPEIRVLGHTYNLAAPAGTYYFAAAILVIALAMGYVTMHGNRGHSLRAVGQDESLAGALGVNVKRLRAVIFVVAAAITGFAGSFSAGYLEVAHPNVWDVFPSVFIVTYAIIGGSTVIVGPIIGSFVVIVGTALFSSGTVYQSVAVGIGLIVVVLFLPEGIGGLVLGFVHYVTRKLPFGSERGKAAAAQIESRKEVVQ